MTHDPGGKSLFAMKPGVAGQAYLSDDEVHRIWLSRRWGPGARYVCFVGKNPSVACPELDDPTIGRECGFARRWGFDGYFKINLSTYRTTDPKKLPRDGLLHADALHCARKIAARSSLVVLAYGTVDKKLRPLETAMLTTIVACKQKFWCLGLTQNGCPKHPLYLANDTPLSEFKLDNRLET